MEALVREGLRDYPNTTHVVYLGFGVGTGYKVETVGRNYRAIYADANFEKPGMRDIPLLNAANGPIKVTLKNPSPLVDSLQKWGIKVVKSDNAGQFLCDAMTYKIGMMQNSGTIHFGAFTHVASTFGFELTHFQDAIIELLGPTGDFDGDGIRNSDDPFPFGPEVYPIKAPC